MSDYHLVTTLHAARVTLADARKADDAADAVLAEAEAVAARARERKLDTSIAVLAAQVKVADARTAVDAALADGRVMSDKHLLNLDLDCLGAILSHLNPDDALSAAFTCTTLRSALFRGGLPWPLAGVCRKWWPRREAAAAEAALRALDGMQPALGALRLGFDLNTFDESIARVLARALDAAPRAARIDITVPDKDFGVFNEDDAGRLVDILTSPDRAFAAPPQVHMNGLEAPNDSSMLRLVRAGVCIASISQSNVSNDPRFSARIPASVANTLTRVDIRPSGAIRTTRFPALRKLNMDIQDLDAFTTDTQSLTALAPHLKEIKFDCSNDDIQSEPQRHGFGFEPGRFAQFVVAIQGVRHVCFGDGLYATLSRGNNENLGQLTALRTLRDLEISYNQFWIEDVRPPPRRRPFPKPVAKDAIINLPPMPTALTRLALSGAARVAFVYPLPELRVLDWRGSKVTVACDWFRWDEENDEQPFQMTMSVELDVPIAVPSAAIAPNLHTLLIGYNSNRTPLDAFDLLTLVAERTALRVIVIERARLLCSAPGDFETTTAGFAALLARDAKDLVSVHAHGCEIESAHRVAVENFFRALEQRGVRVCRAGVKECLFCMLHDGEDLWPRYW